MLMDRDGEHPRIGIERALYAITVMDIDIEIGDAVETVVEQP